MTAQTPSPPGPKKAYAAPKLVRYGDVRVLTQSGSGTMTETMLTGQPAKRPSSRVAKQNIVHMGRHRLGFGLYLFDYRPEFRDRYGHGRQFGAMADEVEQIMPQAVSLNSLGHQVVDYAMLGVRPSVR